MTATGTAEKKKWRVFKSARTFSRSLLLRSETTWERYCAGKLKGRPRKPDDIPRNPWVVYRGRGWKDIGDWLGGPPARSTHWRPFVHARAYVRTLGLATALEWHSFCKNHGLPADIPAGPAYVYRDMGWSGMRDWLGTGPVARWLRKYRSFHEARLFARSLGLSGVKEWGKFCRGMLPDKGVLPADIPAYPHVTYRASGWRGVGDWLGTGNIAPWLRKFRPFEEARAFARSMELRTMKEWTAYCTRRLCGKGVRPADIPSNPNLFYRKSGWHCWGDWLGTGTVAFGRRQYRPFDEARTFACSLKLRSLREWNKYSAGHMPEKGSRPADIPSQPDRTYRASGWRTWGDWLGTSTVASPCRQYQSFRKARAFARSLHLASEKEWRLFCKGMLPDKGTCPTNIPRAPRMTYRGKGWCGFGDWLGTRNASRRANT